MAVEIAVAGCGALGSRIALELARPGRSFLLLDDDVVEERNLAASVFHAHQVGRRKVEALAELLWWRARCPCRAVHRTLATGRLGLFDGAALAVVTFDNAEARNLCNRLEIPVVQVGMSDRGTGVIHWDRPDFGADEHARGQNPVCTGDLSVALVRMVVVAASNEVERWLETGRGRDVFVTENELRCLD